MSAEKKVAVKTETTEAANTYLHKPREEIVQMCVSNPTALFSIKQIGNPLPVDCALLHCEDSVVLEMNAERIVIGDTQSHQLLRVNDEDVKGIEHNVVLDMKEKGERWEGDVLNDQPYGWGVLFDSENRMVYEGFRIGDVNVCYGRSYYPENGKVEYEGEWCEGNRMGAGVLYDRSEVVIHEGEWVNNRPLLTRVEMTDKNPVLHNRVKELIVKDKSCNGKEWKSLDLSLLSKLRKLRIGDECFNEVEKVKLNGLNELESVVVGKESFTFQSDTKTSFEMKDCEKVKELIIGERTLLLWRESL
ncbi:hypothetical protein BLSTO_05865 [Blastocystis sp. subtype 1]